MAWTDCRGYLKPTGSRCSLGISHHQLWPFSVALKGSPQHHLHSRLCIPLGWAVLRELCAAGKFVPLVFWLRVLVLESRKLWLESRG